MWGEIASIILGLAVLLVAGDLLVRGAVGLAKKLNVSPLLISLTVVAFGTSAPEMFVAIRAVLGAHPGVALGNIVGANIANALLVLGIPALVIPICATAPGLRFHAAIMLAATAAFAAIALFAGAIDGAIGGVLVAFILLYVIDVGRRAARSAADPLLYDAAGFADARGGGGSLLVLLAGLVGLPLGAHLLVENAVALAAQLGLREAAVGLTIVAFGTSLPELATVLAAALHKKTDVAIGNVVGSNIFNLLAVGGAAGLAGGAAFDPQALRLEIPAMILAAAVVSAFILARRDIDRLAGFAMTAAYVAFIVLIAATGGAAP